MLLYTSYKEFLRRHRKVRKLAFMVVGFEIKYDIGTASSNKKPNGFIKNAT